MEPVQFPEVNKTYGADQKEYLPLPGFFNKADPARAFTTKWKLSPEELAEVQRTGHVWLTIMTYGRPLQPILFQTVDPFELGRQEEKAASQTRAEMLGHDAAQADTRRVVSNVIDLRPEEGPPPAPQA